MLSMSRILHSIAENIIFVIKAQYQYWPSGISTPNPKLRYTVSAGTKPNWVMLLVGENSADKSRPWWGYYRPATKFKENNVFSSVCLSFCSKGWPLPLMPLVSHKSHGLRPWPLTIQGTPGLAPPNIWSNLFIRTSSHTDPFPRPAEKGEVGLQLKDLPVEDHFIPYVPQLKIIVGKRADLFSYFGWCR